MNRNILCIDLKSFYAFAECIDRNLNPFTTPLVVANQKQGNGAITLAVTPYLKNKGIKSRGRLFEIPANTKYIIVTPRMSFYTEKSKEIISIYLDYVSKEDLHVYSVDEAFLDITDYLKLYNKTDIELANEIITAIYKKTKLVTACGIGSNMFLAKSALDNDAKYQKNNVAKWTYEDVPTKLWKIKQLSDMWGIGYRMEKNLNNIGIHNVYELANYDKNILKDKFGVIGEELWDHANGIDEAIIKEKYEIIRSTSFSNSQILFRDYNVIEIKLIIKETLEVLTSRLRNNNKLCLNIGLGISYSKNIGGGFYHTIKLDTYTDDFHILEKYILLLLDKYIENFPIRKISISLNKLSNNNSLQLNLFDNYKNIERNKKILKAVDIVKGKYGKNSILHANSLLKSSTIIERNKKIGGHYS